MRIADLLGQHRERVSRVVDLDPMGLRLFRYVADLPTAEWPEATDPLPSDTVVLTTLRCPPQFEDDLHTLETRLRHAAAGTVILACLEAAFELTPIPAFEEACNRNGWRIERIAEVSATRLSTGILMEVRPPSGQRAETDLLRLHNGLVLGDHERRRLSRRLAEMLQDGPPAVLVHRATSSEDGPAREDVGRLSQEIDSLKSHVQRLTRERDKAEQQSRKTAAELERLRESASYMVGRAVVQGRRRPQVLLRLPLELRNLIRQRSMGSKPSATRSGSPISIASSATPASTTSPIGTTSVRVSHGEYPAHLPADLARMRIATIARRSLVERMRGTADVLPVVAGGWLGPAEKQLAEADVLLVDASVGALAGNWRGLGDPGEVPRTTQLIDLLGTASVMGLPSVLLVRDGQIPTGLRAIQHRFSVTLHWTLGREGWDPGIPLNQLRWPTETERDESPVYIADAGARWSDLDAAEQWLARLTPRGLRRWLVGTEAVADAGPGCGLETTVFPSAPFGALVERSVVVVPSPGDAFYGTAALAAGCRVLARVPVADWNDEHGLTVMPNPERASAILNAGPAQPAPADVLAVRRRLLAHGSAHERMLRLATLLGLPLVDSLRRRSGVSLLAHVANRRTGEMLARGVLAQEIWPRDVVVATDEPADAPWLNELRASGARIVLRPTSARWSHMAAATRQTLVAAWRDAMEIGPTDVADVELAQLAADAPVGAYGGALVPVDRLTMVSSLRPVGDGLPVKVG